MSGSTSIEWATAVWNPTVGCSRVSAGCERCYAERVAHRGLTEAHRDLTRSTSRGPVWTGEVRLVQKAMDWPLRRRKTERIFVNSMSDVFHESLEDRTIASLFSIMASAHALHGHQHLVLTKRAARMAALVPRFRWLHGLQLVEFANGQKHFLQHRCVLAEDLEADLARGALKVVGEAPADRQFGPWIGSPPGVWLGVSCEDQDAFDERVGHLSRTPAAGVKFLSLEPLLGPIDMQGPRKGGWMPDYPSRPGWDPRGCRSFIDWVIVGGESGPRARRCDVDWIRDVVRQCREGVVPVFVKQLGAKPRPDDWAEWPREAIKFKSALPSLRLRDRKGGDPSEWPEDLRGAREFPR